MDGKKAFFGCLGIIVLLVVLTCGGLLAFSARGPNTWVEAGNQVAPRHMETIKELGILEEGEKIQFFYSDAFADIRKGMYLLTDRRLILHQSESDPATTTIGFRDISEISASWSDSWLDDSQIFLHMQSGDIIGFPLSCENDGDHRFIDLLDKKRLEARGETPAATPEAETSHQEPPSTP